MAVSPSASRWKTKASSKTQREAWRLNYRPSHWPSAGAFVEARERDAGSIEQGPIVRCNLVIVGNFLVRSRPRLPSRPNSRLNCPTSSGSLRYLPRSLQRPPYVASALAGKKKMASQPFRPHRKPDSQRLQQRPIALGKPEFICPLAPLAANVRGFLLRHLSSSSSGRISSTSCFNSRSRCNGQVGENSRSGS